MNRPGRPGPAGRPDPTPPKKSLGWTLVKGCFRILLSIQDYTQYSEFYIVLRILLIIQDSVLRITHFLGFQFSGFCSVSRGFAQQAQLNKV